MALHYVNSSANSNTVVLPPKIDVLKAFQSRQELDFVFPGLLAGGLGMIAAPGATGKSYLLLAMAASVAIGEPLLPTWPKCEPRRVIVYLAEDPPELVHNRLHFLGKLYTPEQQLLLQKNLEVRSFVGVIPTLVEERHGSISRTLLADAIAEDATGARLLVLDPIRRFHSGEENDSAWITALVQVLEGVARKTKTCAVICSHHTAKGATLNGQGDLQQAARGSSAFTDGVRWQANMIVMTDEEAQRYTVSSENRKKYVRLALSKANYTEKSSDVWFERMEGGVLKPWDCTYGTSFSVDSPPSTTRYGNKGGRKHG